MIVADSKVGAAGPQSGSIVAVDTYANIILLDATAYDGCDALATDLGPFGITLRASNGGWYVKNGAYTQLVPNTTTIFEIIANFNGSPAYTQSETVVSVAWTAHGFTAFLNGSRIYLPVASGGLSSGWYTNFQYVDANNFTCISAASGSNTGTLGTNTSETFISDGSAMKIGLMRAGSVASVGCTYIGKGSNSRSLKLYIGGSLVSTVANALQAFNSVSLANVFWQSQTKFTVAAVSTQFTVSNCDDRISVTLSVAGDWYALRRSHIQFFG